MIVSRSEEEWKLFLPPASQWFQWWRKKLYLLKNGKIYCSRKPHKIEKNAELIKKERKYRFNWEENEKWEKLNMLPQGDDDDEIYF